MRDFFMFSLGWRWRWRQQCHTFAYLTVNNYSFARFVRAFFIFRQSVAFSSFPRREMMCFKFAVMCKKWRHHEKFSFFLVIFKPLIPILFRILRRNFAGKMTWNNWKMITETQSSIFRWRSRCRRRCPRLEFWSFLSSIYALNLPVIVFFNVLFGLKSVDKCAKKLPCVTRELRLQIHWPTIHRVNGSIVAS